VDTNMWYVPSHIHQCNIGVALKSKKVRSSPLGYEAVIIYWSP